MGAATQASRYLTLASYFGLLVLLVVWNTVLAPSVRFPTALVLLVLVVPLLLPLRGILHGRPYTHFWTSFVALAYFAHGITEAHVDARDRPYAILEALLSIALFGGCLIYARLRTREIRVARRPVSEK